MNSYPRLNERPIVPGFYKVKAVNYPYAQVEFKASLKEDVTKETFTINLNPLFDNRSQRPITAPVLLRKLIHVTEVYPLKGQPEYVNWTILSRMELMAMQQSAMEINTVALSTIQKIDLSSLTMEESLSMYDKIKENPANVLPDGLEDQCDDDGYMGGDWPEDDAINEPKA